MDDSGRQTGDCQHMRSRDSCVLCLRAEIKLLTAQCDRLKEAIWPGLPKWEPTPEHPQQDFYEAVAESFIRNGNDLRTALRGGKGSPPEGVMHKNLEYFAKLVEDRYPLPDGSLTHLIVHTLRAYAANIKAALEDTDNG